MIGALIEARNRGIIASVVPILEALRDQAGFRVSQALYARILTDEQESTSLDV